MSQRMPDEESIMTSVASPTPEAVHPVKVAAIGNVEVPGKRKPKWIGISLLLVILLAVDGCSSLVSVMKDAQAGARSPYTDMNGRKVVLDDTALLDPSFIQQADLKDDVGVRFKIPTANLNVPLGEVNEVDGLINPPGFTSVYRVRNLGGILEDAAQGTVYVATHALISPGKAPGNYVIDVETEGVTLANGSEIDIGSMKYTVASSEILAKTDMSAQGKLWANTPGMLVFIVGIQYDSKSGSGHSPDYLVIIGQLTT